MRTKKLVGFGRMAEPGVMLSSTLI
ncbi:hypothetical protein Ocin01_13223 [Orchesella cincta]|uniref:Uncharacterized protein n=1 Tax=Orchesella cincta TaxID=48709 RepID=A0A1D2MKB2_ORCCI|nr:hypothetical protein Ocin01_13223 [Orchesella cincta]